MAWHCGSANCPTHSSPEHRCSNWRFAPLTASVGAGGGNRSSDVRVVQGALNRFGPGAGGPEARLATDGVCGPKTIAAIRRVQSMRLGRTSPDGRVDLTGPTVALLRAAGDPSAAASAGTRSVTWSVAAVSWIDPSLRSLLEYPATDGPGGLGLVVPRPRLLSGAGYRFANFLEATVMVDGQGRILKAAPTWASRLYVNSEGSFLGLPIERRGERRSVERMPGAVRFRQIVGCRTTAPETFGMQPLPPIWSELELVIGSDGRFHGKLLRHSRFPSVTLYVPKIPDSAGGPTLYEQAVGYDATRERGHDWRHVGWTDDPLK